MGHFKICIIKLTKKLISWKLIDCRRSVVGRVPAFQPGGPGSIPGGVRNFNSYSGPLSVFHPVLSPAEALTLC